MECPHCTVTLRVLDRSPAPIGTFIRMTCPARACGKQIVARVHATELAAMSDAQVRSHAMRVVFVALRPDFTFPIMGAVGTALVTAFLALWQLLNPSPHGDDMRGVLAITVIGAAFVAVFVLSIVVDFAIGVRRWRNGLPQPLIDVKTMPQDYRT
jgi:hypothetical protein